MTDEVDMLNWGLDNIYTKRGEGIFIRGVQSYFFGGGKGRER